MTIETKQSIVSARIVHDSCSGNPQDEWDMVSKFWTIGYRNDSQKDSFEKYLQDELADLFSENLELFYDFIVSHCLQSEFLESREYNCDSIHDMMETLDLSELVEEVEKHGWIVTFSNIDMGCDAYGIIEPCQIIEEWGCSTDAKDKAQKCADAEMRCYSAWARGECYGFIIESTTHCEHCGEDSTQEIDSCYGFYGMDIDGMVGNAGEEYREIITEAFEHIEY